MYCSLTVGQTSVQFTLPLRPEAGLLDFGLALRLFYLWELLLYEGKTSALETY